MAKLHDLGGPATVCCSIAASALRLDVEVISAVAPPIVGHVRGFQCAPPTVTTVDLNAVPDGVASSSFRPYRLRTVGCMFPEGRAASPTTIGKTIDFVPDADGTADRWNSTDHKRRITRLRPPRDLVKLEDRLRLLLQPPLECLLAAESLRFAARPFAYQLDGIAFLYPRYQAVLADEMGLGKTMQAITAVRLLTHHGQLRRVLLVCPKPLVTNWQREFALWAPELTVTTVEGNPTRRQWLWRRAKDVVVIANYETVVRDSADVCDPLNSYDLVILDEAQRIKNRDNLTNQVAAAIPRSRSWALTGTPIENSVEDLVGIFEFVAPGQVDGTMKPRAIGRAASDYVLRRTKEQVLTDLPPKLFRDAEVELTPEQAASYQLAEDEGVVRLREMKHEITIQHVFELVLRLKQICNFDPTTGASSKLERLEADLEECAASGRKAIVFSQWVQTLTELRERLARFTPVEYHGQVPHRRRDAVIERFRADKDCHVMLMSYGAGSVGLNLQFANYVFLFDRWWNPAVEDQAINRAHRIGVKSPVTITRFLTIGTIEQRINEILEKKRELFDTVFRASISTPRSGLSREEVFSLFDLRSAGNETQGEE
jgi:SNF2 family DNA or RNA helicase